MNILLKDAFLDRNVVKLCLNCGAEFYRDKRCTWAYWRKAKFCSRECTGAHNSARAEILRPSRREAFYKWFQQGDGCWEWQGAVDRDGYGIFSFEGRTSRAARVALEMDGRPPAANEYACHHCDNPRCVRPAHLYPGTPTDNVKDMVHRGRANWHNRSSSKLTESDVLDIRAANEPHGIVASKYGVSQSLIYQIRKRKIWRDVA